MVATGTLATLEQRPISSQLPLICQPLFHSRRLIQLGEVSVPSVQGL